MKKNFRSVLTLLLVVMMLFSVAAPVVGSAAESELFVSEAAASAPAGNASEEDPYDIGWLKIERDGEHITVTLSPDIDSLMDLDKAKIKEVIREVIDLAKELVINVMRNQILDGQYGNEQEGLDSLDNLWTIAFEGYCDEKGIEGEGDEVYLNFFKESLTDASLADGLVEYACDSIRTAVKLGAVSTEELKAMLAEGKLDKAIDAALKDVMDEMVEGMLVTNADEYVSYIFDLANDGSAVNADVLAFADSELASHAYAIARNVYNSGTPDDSSKLALALSALVLAGKAEGKALDEIITRHTAVEVLRTSVAAVTEGVDELKAEVKELVSGDAVNAEYTDKVYEAVLGATKADFENTLKAYTSKMVKGFEDTVQYLENNIDSDVGILDIVKLVDLVEVNGHAIFNDGKVVTSGFKALLLELPNFYEIAQMTDDEMQLTYGFKIGTKYGDCTFSVTGKIGGGYDEIRQLAGVISRNIDVRILEDGTIDLDINVPEKFSQLVLRAAESGQFSDSLKHKIFAAFMKDGNDLYVDYQKLDFNDIVAILESINFEGLLDKEFIKQYVDLTHLTNEQIVDKVKQYERYFNLLKKYADKVVNFAVNRIPDKYMDNDILSVFDHVDPNDKFSYSNGNFGYEGTHTLEYDLVLRAINKVASKLENYISLEKYGIKDLGALVTSLVPQYYIDNGFTLSVDIDVNVHGINRVDYYVDGKLERYGLLPKGADVEFFGLCTRPDFLYWIDQDGNKVTKMPDRDVVLTAVLAGSGVNSLGNISAVYGEEHTVGVFVGLADLTGVTYEWFKNGTLISNDTATFTVKNVSDSGTYTCVVRQGGAELGTATIEVKITPAEIDVSGIELVEDLFEFDGETHSVSVDESTVPANVKVTVDGVTSTDARGTHKVTLNLESTDSNYELSESTLTLEWGIKELIDASEFIWPYDDLDGTDPETNRPIFVYRDGTTYTVKLEIASKYLSKLNVTYKNNSASGEGVYFAEVASIDVKSEYADQYAVINVDMIPKLEWHIVPQNLKLEDVFEWIADDSYTYTGSEQGLELAFKAGVSNELKRLVAEYVDIILEDATATDVGTYTAKASFALKAGVEHIALVGANVPEMTWSIEKQVINVDELEWTSDAEFVYNGELQKVELTGTLPSVLEIESYFDNEKKDAGDYTAEVWFNLLDTKNYELSSDTLTHEWSIAKKSVDVSAYTWTNGEFVFDGETKTVTLEGVDTTLVNVEYTENEKSAAGQYTATATLTPKDSVNYVLVGETSLTKTWNIAEKVIVVTDITWNSSFTYDGNSHQVTYTLTLADPSLEGFVSGVMAEGLLYTHTAVDVKTDGNYLVSLTLSSNSANYIVDCTAIENELVHEWNIAPKAVNLSELTWTYTAAFTYNGTAFTVALSSTEGLSVVYTDNEKTGAGVYTASAVATPVDGNYSVVGELPTLQWEIKKATIDLSSLVLEDASVVFDGKAHSLKVAGNEDVLAFFDISYEGNGKTLLGTYTVTAKLTLKDEYAANYMPATYELEAQLSITGTNKVDYDYMNGTIKIEVQGGLPADNLLSGSIVTDLEDEYKLDDGKKVEILAAYDIHFERDGKELSFDGKKFTVQLLIPAEYRNLDAEKLMVIHFSDDGVIDVMDAEREGDYMVFETEGFSVYAIVKVQSNNLLWLWILLACLVVAIAIAVCIILFYKKDDNNEPTPDAIPDVEPEFEAEEEPVEEAPVEEVPDEEPELEEAPVEEVPDEEPELEEAPVEEVPDEEPVAEETPVEETPVEETPAEEEPAAEETLVEETPAEEEPAVEETPVEEALAEEEPAAEETPVEETPAEEEPAAPIVIDQSAVLTLTDDKATKATAVVGGQTVLIRFRRSFMSRLIQSSDKIQGYYTAIKNQLLSYKGVKVRSSWNYEAFNKGRVQCAKLNIKGKTLIVNLNLDPAEFNINKYHFLDMSAKPKYAKVPMMMKVRSDRALKYTLELIDEMMKALGVPQRDIPTEDYRMPYETTEQLARRGLVKVILPAGVTLSDDMNVVHMNVTEYIESDNAAAEKTTEQVYTTDEPVIPETVEETPVEEAPVEETPVEEAPVEETPVEEAPVEEVPVEEAPVEETPVEEAPAEEAPVEEAPVEETPVEEAPVEETPVEETPVEEAPVEEAPVEEAPVEETPVEETPVEEAPVEEAPVEEAPVEETPVEEAPVEETPVEEAPVEETPVEEAPVEETPVEETPVEETPVEEAPAEEIHVDADTADELVTDEEAEAHLEIVHTGASFRQGKMGEVNLDLICENFEDGETVDVDALKAKRLISSKISRVKILARGIMTKKLTIVASKFSLQAVKMIKLAGGKAELED